MVSRFDLLPLSHRPTGAAAPAWSRRAAAWSPRACGARPRSAASWARARHLQRAASRSASRSSASSRLRMLGPRVLGDGGHARAQSRRDPRLLSLGERARRVHVEHRLDPRGGDVGVLTARTGRALVRSSISVSGMATPGRNGKVGIGHACAQLRATPDVRVGVSSAQPGVADRGSLRSPRTSAPVGGSRSASLLRLRSDEQLLALFRARQRRRVPHASTTATASGCSPTCARCSAPRSRQDAEDVLQDVFVRAYGALRADDRAGERARVAVPRRPQPLHRPPAPPGPAPRRRLRDLAQAAARPDRGGPAARGPAPAGRPTSAACPSSSARRC